MKRFFFLHFNNNTRLQITMNVLHPHVKTMEHVLIMLDRILVNVWKGGWEMYAK